MFDDDVTSVLQRFQAQSQTMLANAVGFNKEKIGNGSEQDREDNELNLRYEPENFEAPMGKQHLRDLQKPHQRAGEIEEIERIERNEGFEEESVGNGDSPEISSDSSKETPTVKVEDHNLSHEFYQHMPAMFVPNYAENSFQFDFHSNAKVHSIMNPNNQHLRLPKTAHLLDSAGNIRVSSALVRKHFNVKVFYLLLVFSSAVLYYIRCVLKTQSESEPLLRNEHV